jgi:hypothetical protein
MYWQRHHAGKTRDPKRFVHQSLQAYSSTIAAAGEPYRLKIEALEASSSLPQLRRLSLTGACFSFAQRLR